MPPRLTWDLEAIHFGNPIRVVSVYRCNPTLKVIAADAAQIELAWSIARQHLVGGRLQHTEGAARAALHLAPMFGAYPHKAVVAAILHDIARDVAASDLVRLAQSKGIIVRTADVLCPVLLHGRIAAVIAKESGILDSSVLDAVARHVTGQSGWTSLDQAVYLADKVEALKNAIRYSMDNVPFFVDPETVVVFNEVSQSLAQAPEC